MMLVLECYVTLGMNGLHRGVGGGVGELGAEVRGLWIRLMNT